MSQSITTTSNLTTLATDFRPVAPIPRNSGRHLQEYWDCTLSRYKLSIIRHHSAITNSLVVHGYFWTKVQLRSDGKFITRCDPQHKTAILLSRDEIIHGLAIKSRWQGHEDIPVKFRFGKVGCGWLNLTDDLELQTGVWYTLEVSVSLIEVMKLENVTAGEWTAAAAEGLVWRYPDEAWNVADFMHAMGNRIEELDALKGEEGEENALGWPEEEEEVDRHRIVRGMRY